MTELKTKILLKDSQGKILEIKELSSESSNEFDVDKLNDGVYFVELSLPHGKTITHQFSVNHN
ncbi:hypothetical protein Emtol_3986 [Emticicia oligotrophica DSM 17448]|uniref:Secretion system C-terminal sorting domain-containing protein n=1 Tax=Emticicia oligotrophica (strain DSM 17448 / CIP 109782 / MTCC 6937 / GPTSA100-15) TaxID=929562 RepID=A0ABN4AT72_EMTOG|nr:MULTISPECIES: T9SS type A sorting domain-containing protein [Emticicia]AFK05111.1 hypothetical protein Emtol_3986 [Emticicia oligotrophica DSM 17448]